ncbi:MAG: hypothetical protein HGA45_16535 [Chloroflexales bacterium]|nr:hypothetical protein [Chloroflexales bacterium]
MDDAHGYEERVDGSDDAQITANGDYLCVHHEGHPRHIYKRVPAGAQPHPLVSRRVYDGALYSLAWIEDDD